MFGCIKANKISINKSIQRPEFHKFFSLVKSRMDFRSVKNCRYLITLHITIYKTFILKRIFAIEHTIRLMSIIVLGSMLPSTFFG